MRPSSTKLVMAGLAIALLIGTVLANFAAGAPDAFQRAVLDSACQDAVHQEACLAEKEGEPVLLLAPGALLDYANVPLSGFVGVVGTFLLGSALVYLLRLSRRGAGREGAPDDAGPAT